MYCVSSRTFEAGSLSEVRWLQSCNSDKINVTQVGFLVLIILAYSLHDA